MNSQTVEIEQSVMGRIDYMLWVMFELGPRIRKLERLGVPNVEAILMGDRVITPWRSTRLTMNELDRLPVPRQPLYRIPTWKTDRAIRRQTLD